MFKEHNYLSKPFKLIAYFCLLLLFSACKKEITKNDSTASGIKYISAGLNDKVRKVERTSDGGFIYCGFTGKESSTNAFMMKVDASGNREWYKTYGGINSDQFFQAIECSDGGFMAVGNTNSMGKGVTDSNFTYMDYIVKTNAMGEQEWEKSFSGNSGFDIALRSVVEAPDHYFYATGDAWGVYPNEYPNVVLSKFDISGKSIYQKQFTVFGSYPPKIIKTTSAEYGTYISVNTTGDLIIGGLMHHTSLSFYSGEYITFMMSVKTSGAVNFFYPYYDYIRPYNYFGGFAYQKFHTVKIVNLNDGYLITTFIDLPGAKLSIQLLKTDLSGNIVWEKKYEGLGSALVDDINILADGSIILLGSSSAERIDYSFPELFSYLKTMLMKLDKDGNIIFTRYIGSKDNASLAKCIQTLPDGGWAIAGYTSLTSIAYDKIFWMSVNNNGELSSRP